jgi:ribose/xylose/arabinose/galactoside ABC-type transport system permease subunit
MNERVGLQARKTASVQTLLSLPWLGPFIALVFVYALFTALVPDTFAGGVNLMTMLRQTAVVGIAAVGMSLVIVKGGIDLSVGSAVALVTVIIATALRAGHGPYVAALAGVTVGALTGLVNGALTASLRITPFIVTLGTMSVLRGVAKGLADEQKIDADPRGLDQLMAMMPGEHFVAPPSGVWIAVLVAIAGAILLGYTRFGRHVVAIGSNELTARLCGVPVPRVTVLTYGIAGLLAGIAGVLEYSTLTVGDPTDSVGLELEVIAAVVIGGGSLSGGQGSVAGAMVGALLLTVIKTGCVHVGLPNWVQEILTGCIIVVAMGIDRLRQRAR